MLQQRVFNHARRHDRECNIESYSASSFAGKCVVMFVDISILILVIMLTEPIVYYSQC